MVSTFNEVEITCKECGEKFDGTIWTAVHATENPVLKDLLLGGELNLFMCPKCSHIAYEDHFVLYQDPEAELIAYIYPPAQVDEADFLRKTTLLNFAEAQKIYKPKDRKDYDPLLVFGLETFVEMMHEEESREAQSQIAEAVCKDHQLPFEVLRPSEARRHSMVRVLPTRKGFDRQEILVGLDKLLAINAALDRYSALRKLIREDPLWKLIVNPSDK